MHIGINYPWIDYGWDFGDPPSAWVAPENRDSWRESKRRQIESDFKLFSEQGLFAVRWFLTGDGLNYGMGAEAPREAGGQWTFDPLPAGHPYYGRLLDDFQFVLQICSDSRLKLLPVLIDFSWCMKGNPMGSTGIVKCGRSDVVRDPLKRNSFFDRVLDPLLACSMRYRDCVYAWEVINEPEWVVRQGRARLQGSADRVVSQEEMNGFIADGVRRIHSVRLPDGSRAFASTAGFAHWDSLNTWDAPKLGITLHQFHYYAQQNRALPECSSVAVSPCIVGEFATAVEKDWPDLKLQGVGQTTANRLSCIESRGYDSCFLWSARAIDRATRWTDEECRAVMAYAGTGRPGGVMA